MVIESKEPRNLRERKNELCLCPVCRIEGSGFALRAFGLRVLAWVRGVGFQLDVVAGVLETCV